MRVLYMANAAQIGGGNRVLLQLCAGVVARGIRPFIVLPTNGPMQAECDKLRIPFTVIPYRQPSLCSPIKTWRDLKQWRRLLRKIKPDVIHANDVYTGRCIRLACWMEKVPILYHIHFPPGDAGIAWAARRLPKPAAVVFCSSALHKESGPAFQRACPRSQQFVIHNAIPLDQFAPGGVISNPVGRVGIVANLIPIKGHLDFFAMAADLTARRVSAEYWVIGEDIYETGYKAVLQRRVRELGLEDRVRFLGHCSNVPELLRQLDVVVCSSHVEPFGMCALEAMACARPVVATAVGGLADIVDNGKSGDLVPPHAPAELAKAVERLLNNPDLRDAYGRAGRSRAENHFSQDVYVTKTLAVYRQLAAQGQSNRAGRLLAAETARETIPAA